MALMLDTNIAILLRDGDSAVAARIGEQETSLIFSIITRVELEGGVYRDPANAPARHRRLDLMLASIATVPFDDDAAAAYGRIVAHQGFSRRKAIDRMIAAQAIVHGARLATRNPGDFAGIPDLVLEKW
jgi:predicted nucleic acid-binding protein